MLLRVIITEHDIRRVTVENLPDTVADLDLILKKKTWLGRRFDLAISGSNI